MAGANALLPPPEPVSQAQPTGSLTSGSLMSGPLTTLPSETS